MRPLLTVKEASLLLKVNPFWLYQLVRERRIPALRIGRTIRFQPERLEDWLSFHSAPGEGTGSDHV